MATINIENNLYKNKKTFDCFEGAFFKKWIQRDNYIFLAKLNYSNSSNENFGEVLYSHICKKLGVPCVECAFAQINDDQLENMGIIPAKNGVLIKNLLADDEKLITYRNILDDLWWLSEKNIENSSPKFKKIYKEYIAEKNLLRKNYNYYNSTCAELINCDLWLYILQLYCEKNNLQINMQSARIDFYKQVVLDFFLMQRDRNLGNFGIIVKDNVARVSPIFDNGMCLFFSENANRSEQNIFNDIMEQRGTIDFKPEFDFTNLKRPKTCNSSSAYCYDVRNDILSMKKLYDLTEKYPEIKKMLDDYYKLDLYKELLTINEIARWEKCEQLPQNALNLCQYFFKYIKTNYQRFANIAKEKNYEYN